MSAARQDIERHLSPTEIAERLGLERHAVLRMMRPGQLWPVVRINRAVIRVPASVVAAFLRSRTWSPTVD